MRKMQVLLSWTELGDLSDRVFPPPHLRPLEAADAHSDVRCVDHAHVVGAVPNAETDLAQRLFDQVRYLRRQESAEDKETL